MAVNMSAREEWTLFMLGMAFTLISGCLLLLAPQYARAAWETASWLLMAGIPAVIAAVCLLTLFRRLEE